MGAPKGNKNASRERRQFRAALERAIAQYEADGLPRGEALNRVTEKLLEQALAGEQWAVKEIADRLDGRPAQVVTGEDGGSAFVLRLVTGDDG